MSNNKDAVSIIPPDDPELIKRAADGDGEAYEALAKKYGPLFLSMAARYSGGDAFSRDDLIQEAHIAFLNAVRNYRSKDGGVTFGLYAKICIKNKLISCLRKSKKKVLVPENGGYASEKKAAERERVKELFDSYGGLLSGYEKAALAGYLANKSYREIAKSLGKSEKSVDNALLRVRNKIRAAEKKKSAP